MKTRIAFVSNSSSASFIIGKKNLTAEQLDKIRNHDELGEEMGIAHAKDWAWEIREQDDMIAGETWMDNFDMREFMERIGVPDSIIEWGEFPMFDWAEKELLPFIEEENKFLVKLEELAEIYYKSKDCDRAASEEVKRFVEWAKKR